MWEQVRKPVSAEERMGCGQNHLASLRAQLALAHNEGGQGISRLVRYSVRNVALGEPIAQLCGVSSNNNGQWT
ncbi:MAG: hypothetical protein GPOALKHO_001255 [Sodalis sp.]|nr:MAG: hypothetical protein GPOALKHO_001255 [Sodalis sp.]